MFRLEHEVIVFLGAEQLDDGPAAHAILEAVVDLGAEVRSPAAEVVVDVDCRNAALMGARLEGRDLPGHGQRMAQELVALGKLKVIDHVDQQQGDAGLVWSVAVQVFIFRGHGDLSPIGSRGRGEPSSTGLAPSLLVHRDHAKTSPLAVFLEWSRIRTGICTASLGVVA